MPSHQPMTDSGAQSQIARLPNPDLDYLRRLGRWIRTHREEAQESQIQLVKAMSRSGLDWSDNVIRWLEKLALLPDDADTSHMQINHLVIRWLARHYGTSLSELEAYLEGYAASDPMASADSEDATIARSVAQMTPEQKRIAASFTQWIVKSDPAMWMPPARVVGGPGASVSGLHRRPSAARVAHVQAQMELEASAEEAARQQGDHEHDGRDGKRGNGAERPARKRRVQ